MYTQLMELSQKRRSIRKFSEEKVSEEIINQVLDVIKLSPTAGNLEDFKVTVVKSREIRQDLQEITFVDSAPVVLIFSALPEVSSKYYGKRGKELYSVQDATIACTYAMLAVEALGLVTTWVGNFDVEEVKGIIGGDPMEVPVAILPIGYPPSDFVANEKEEKVPEIKYL
ncbi:MAG: nitroreductase family protein [Clostridiaceae bacterium]